MSLPRFTKDQQKFVVANLIVMTPHREIARKFQRLFPYFVPQDLDQAAYEEAFIKRAIAPLTPLSHSETAFWGLSNTQPICILRISHLKPAQINQSPDYIRRTKKNTRIAYSNL